MSGLDLTLLRDQIECYQIQRHDFLNNFQVIRGYLQLNMPDKALAYIDEAIAELLPQQEIYALGHKHLLAILLGLFFGLRLKGVKMTIDCPFEMKDEVFWKERWNEEYAHKFYGYTKECLDQIPQDENPDDLTAEIHLSAIPQGFGAAFKLLCRGKVNVEKVFATNLMV